MKGKIKKSAKNYLANIEKMVKMQGKVGILGGKDTPANYPSGESVYDVALQHEYGNPHKGIPQRSFMRLTAKKKGAVMAKITIKEWNNCINGANPAIAMGKIVAQFRNYVIDTFKNEGYGQWQPLSEVTKKIRASRVKGGANNAKILTDTGRLWQSVNTRVEKNDKRLNR